MTDLPGEPAPTPGDSTDPSIGGRAASGLPAEDRSTSGPPASAGDARSARGSIGRSSAILASGTIVSRVLGFLKAIVLAAAVGQVASEAGNAFGIANQLPNNIYALVAGGVLSAVLVPQIVRASLSEDGGKRYIDKIVTLGTIVFLVLAVIATLAAPLLVQLYAQGSDDGRGFSPRGLALATALAYWCLPQIFFYALYSLLGEVLNARRAFGAFTWAPVLNNVVSIAGLIAFMLLFGGEGANRQVSEWDSARIAVIAGSATLGVATQALILIAFWRRAGLSFRPDFRWRGAGLSRAGKAAGWTFGMFAVTQVAAVVQSRVASIAANDGASVLALQNSWLIFILPHSVIAVSLATAYFTRMSSHASRSDFAALRADVSASLSTIGLFITFSSVALVVVAFPFARVFEASFPDVAGMAFVIIAFVIGLVPFSALFVMQRGFYSLEDTRTPFIVEAIKATVFIAGALLCALLPTAAIGVGIALVTTVACSLQSLITFVLLRRRIGPLNGRLLLRRHVQYLVAALLAAVVGVGLLVLLGGLDPAGFAQSGRIQAIVAISGIGVGMAAVYAGVLLLMRNPELGRGIELVTRRIRRR